MSPLDFPTTASRDPGADVRVRCDLVRIAGVAARDPALRALVLTGGFSRGEGTVRRGRPVNDYDLVAVRDRPGTSRVAHDVRALEPDLGVHVDYLEVWRPRLRVVGPKLFWFDLRRGGRVLAGDAAVLGEVRSYAAGDLPAEEGLRLLANRAAGLLIARGGPDDLVDVQAAKALLAVAEARLVADGAYAPTLAERRAAFRSLATRDAAARRALPWIERAVAFKLDPDAAPLPPDEAWQAAREHLLAALPDVARRTRHGTVSRWLASGSAVEAAIHVLRALRDGRSPARRASARARAAILALLEDLDAVPPAAAEALEAFGETVRSWRDARAAALRARALTLQ